MFGYAFGKLAGVEIIKEICAINDGKECTGFAGIYHVEWKWF